MALAWRGMLLAAACALAVNAPHFWRNYEVSGSVLGFDSAQGNGVYRWRNESFGWKQTASNLLRNTSEQLGARGDGWNQGVYRMALSAHHRLGIDPNDPATTWPGTAYAPPRNANHESDAPNRWHLALLLVTSCVLGARLLRGRDRTRAWYALALFGAFAAFCAYLKWQPFGSRLILPLFVLGAPLISVLLEPFPEAWRQAGLLSQIVLCLFLLDNARHPLLDNWVRPLRGPKSVFTVPRQEQYFADMTQWNNADTYRKTVGLLATTPCGVIALDINNLQLEYPLQALLLEHNSKIQFLHTGVENPSRRYPQPTDRRACAVVCLDCAGDLDRVNSYREYAHRDAIGKFLIFRD